jgi:hypothetical protein
MAKLRTTGSGMAGHPYIAAIALWPVAKAKATRCVYGQTASQRAARHSLQRQPSLSRLSAMIYVGRPRTVDCGLQPGSPGGIGVSPAPRLVSTNADVDKRLLERHALSKQLE